MALYDGLFLTILSLAAASLCELVVSSKENVSKPAEEIRIKNTAMESYDFETSLRQL